MALHFQHDRAEEIDTTNKSQSLPVCRTGKN